MVVFIWLTVSRNMADCQARSAVQDIGNARNVYLVIADGQVIDPKQIPQLVVAKK